MRLLPKKQSRKQPKNEVTSADSLALAVLFGHGGPITARELTQKLDQNRAEIVGTPPRNNLMQRKYGNERLNRLVMLGMAVRDDSGKVHTYTITPKGKRYVNLGARWD